MYNRANFIIRKEFIENQKFVSVFDLNKQLKHEDCFMTLPAKTAQMTIMKLGKNWLSFFRSIKRWSKDKSGYTGRPNLPKYKDKKNGRFVAYFDQQQIKIKDGLLYFQEGRGVKSFRTIKTKITKEQLRQIQIIPQGGCYKISIIYHKETESKITQNTNYLSIDLGVNNLATLTNNIGLNPIIINGRIIKSKNNYYNKLLAKAMSYVGTGKSKRITKISDKRNNITENHLHKVSNWIIDYCLKNNISNIAIGKNNDWKRFSNIGYKNNQALCTIPFENLINKIKYKGEDVGINVFVDDETYTSQSSFIDNDILPDKYGDYGFSGKRIKRGLYKSKNSVIINADVNGSYNILRKRIPEFKYDDRIMGVALHPIKINVS